MLMFTEVFQGPFVYISPFMKVPSPLLHFHRHFPEAAVGSIAKEHFQTETNFFVQIPVPKVVHIVRNCRWIIFFLITHREQWLKEPAAEQLNPNLVFALPERGLDEASLRHVSHGKHKHKTFFSLPVRLFETPDKQYHGLFICYLKHKIPPHSVPRRPEVIRGVLHSNGNGTEFLSITHEQACDKDHLVKESSSSMLQIHQRAF